MSDIVLALIALGGIIGVAASGVRFIARDDLRLDEAVRIDLPAAWGERSADEVAAR
ncbi:hypothetical protein QT381_13155 [Galbitalea sp. SE-J8]|uniref:hypothetical protein n=1 Tax=Galbitalea sp. SE-J8 TaxID=3054952 RepID=UPI00259C9133|nr:hypothetical protein [Galbitalea sp. SE-J8]MDM4763956.1 hypothetical protein [Galbitalea sp. SE-J8]